MGQPSDLVVVRLVEPRELLEVLERLGSAALRLRESQPAVAFVFFRAVFFAELSPRAVSSRNVAKTILNVEANLEWCRS